MLFDHVDLRVTSFSKVRALYDALLPAMGYVRIVEDADSICYYDQERDRSTSSRLINPTGRAWPCERQAAPRWTPWAKSLAWPARQLSSLRTSARNIRPFTTRRFLRMPTATNSKFVSGKLRPRTPLVELCPSPQLATLAEFILSEGAKRRSRRARDDKAGVRCAQGDNVARSLRTNSAA
jgi:hypothetical protein